VQGTATMLECARGLRDCGTIATGGSGATEAAAHTSD
jgi:hypothetical protein